jgi:hypothetical protein
MSFPDHARSPVTTREVATMNIKASKRIAPFSSVGRIVRFLDAERAFVMKRP